MRRASIFRYAQDAFYWSAVILGAAVFGAASQRSKADQPPFPETEKLMARVAQHQKEIEALVDQYTFTDKTTEYELDKNGKVKSVHTDVYYLTPTAYEIFTLHISHDGKAVSQGDLEKQEKEIEKRIAENERRAQHGEPIHPRGRSKSRFTPLRWEDRSGCSTVVYAYEPNSAAAPQGNLEEKITGDMKGQMWVSPQDEEIVRIEFTSVSSFTMGMGILGKVKSFQGFTEQKKIHGEVWLPTYQEYVADGRQFISGYRIRSVSEFSDYLKATTDVFQQIHAPNAVEAAKAPR